MAGAGEVDDDTESKEKEVPKREIKRNLEIVVRELEKAPGKEWQRMANEVK